MTREYYEEHITLCKCGLIPDMVKTIHSEITFLGEKKTIKYRVKCDKCGYMSGVCKSSEGALKSWNKLMKRMESQDG